MYQSDDSDRFIPNRSAMDIEVGHFNLMKENMGECSPSKQHYKEELANSLFQGSKVDDLKILALKNKAPAPKEGLQNRLRVLYTQNSADPQQMKKQAARYLPQTSERVLDAPDILDDYYLNLLDWSSSNLLAVALSQSLYVWNATTSEITKLLEFDGVPITSVAWMSSGSHIAIGTDSNEVQLWDVTKGKQVRTFKGHQSRVGALAWNSFVLSTGSRDSSIMNFDVRQASAHLSTWTAHTQEVCGLKWSHDGTQLASGGNDNLLNIWEMNQQAPKFTLTEHCAAVKALSWCPWQPNLLASGGGTSDRTIRFWNTQTGVCMNQIDTESQVCAIEWSTQYKELISSHGFAKNQLCVWKYPSLVKVGEMLGHQARVLHMSLSPDGQTVVSAAADETLRFWRVWQPKETKPVSAVATKAGHLTVKQPGKRMSMNKIR